MISTCEAYRQSEQKRCGKFCSHKTAKKRKTHPIQPEKGETGCVLGAGGDENGCEQVRTDRKDRKARRNSWDGLVSAAASVGPGRSPPGCRPPRHAPQAGLRAHLVAKSYRTLTKKSGTAQAIPDFFGRGRRTRTLGTRFWSGCGRTRQRAGEGAVLADSPGQVPKEWCWFGAAWKNPAAESVERPGKGLVHIVSHEIVRRAGRYVVERLYPLAVNGGRVWVSHARPKMHRIIPGAPLE